MERREALKNIGFGSMGLFVGTAFFGALQGCSSTPKVNWIPAALTPAEAAQLERFCEAVLPPTDTPGAIQAGVPQHLDKAMSAIYQDKDVDYIKRGMAVFVKNYNAHHGGYNSATTEELTAVINGYFKDYEADAAKMEAFKKGYADEGEKSEEWLETFFVNNMVDATFWSYFTSELVGETVMRYDPIPGKYEGCIPYEPGQRAWSIV